MSRSSTSWPPSSDQATRAKLGAIGILRRILERLRRAFPRARFRVRLDGGFACPEILDFLDEQPKVDYVVAMAKNLTLEWKAERLMRSARKLSRKSEKTEHVYGECRYRAKTWDRERRVYSAPRSTRPISVS